MIADYIETMNPDNLNKTIIGGHLKWRREDDGTYTQAVTFLYKDGERDEDIIRQNISEKEYFIRSLDGTKGDWTKAWSTMIRK